MISVRQGERHRRARDDPRRRAPSTFPELVWAGPLAGIRIGRINGEFIANPTFAERETSDMDIMPSPRPADATRRWSRARWHADAVVERRDRRSSCSAHKAKSSRRDRAPGAAPCRARQGEAPGAHATRRHDESLAARIKELAWEKLGTALQIKDKKKRYAEVHTVKTETLATVIAEGKLTSSVPDGKAFEAAFGKLHKKWARGHTLSTRKRIDGRNPDEIRAIVIETGVLPRAHGSALFQRGETQALVAVTLGTKYDEKKLDTLLGDKKRYRSSMDYNFPPFSTG